MEGRSGRARVNALRPAPALHEEAGTRGETVLPVCAQGVLADAGGALAEREVLEADALENFRSVSEGAVPWCSPQASTRVCPSAEM